MALESKHRVLTASHPYDNTSRLDKNEWTEAIETRAARSGAEIADGDEPVAVEQEPSSEYLLRVLDAKLSSVNATSSNLEERLAAAEEEETETEEDIELKATGSNEALLNAKWGWRKAVMETLHGELDASLRASDSRPSPATECSSQRVPSDRMISFQAAVSARVVDSLAISADDLFMDFLATIKDSGGNDPGQANATDSGDESTRRLESRHMPQPRECTSKEDRFTGEGAMEADPTVTTLAEAQNMLTSEKMSLNELDRTCHEADRPVAIGSALKETAASRFQRLRHRQLRKSENLDSVFGPSKIRHPEVGKTKRMETILKWRER